MSHRILPGVTAASQNFQKTLKSSSPEAERVKKSEPVVKDPNQQAELKKTCQEFEAIFLQQMMSKMREATMKSDLMGSRREEEMFLGLLDEEVSRQMAAGGGVGLADLLYRQLNLDQK